MKALSDTPLADLAAPVAVVAHDAGAANHIAAWLGTESRNDYAAALGGPAKTIFAERCAWLASQELERLVPGSKTLISGTGWASSMEHDARRLAKSVGCRSIAVIDHWTDYRKRFSRLGQELLPDEIWVADEYAQKLAQTEFPSIPVVLLPNVYLERLASEVREKQPLPGASHTGNILYVLEPVRDDWGALPKPGEFLALEFFVENLKTLGFNEGMQIRLRPHPSDPVDKYDGWIKAHPNLDLMLDNTRSLASALAWADVVVGCQTYAMVVALAAGKRVVCSIPPGMPPCVLPQQHIIHLAKLVV